MRYARDKEDAEDILQDSFIKIFKKINQVKGEGSFEGWMRRVVVNTALKKYTVSRYSKEFSVKEVKDTTVANDKDIYFVHENIYKHYFMEVAGIAQTILTVKLPTNYTNTNTASYVSFNDETCIAGLKANVALHTFISPILPVNRPVTVVVISKQAGDYYLGIQQTTTSVSSSNPSTTILITPIKRTLEYIKTYLNSL